MISRDIFHLVSDWLGNRAMHIFISTISALLCFATLIDYNDVQFLHVSYGETRDADILEDPAAIMSLSLLMPLVLDRLLDIVKKRNFNTGGQSSAKFDVFLDNMEMFFVVLGFASAPSVALHYFQSDVDTVQIYVCARGFRAMLVTGVFLSVLSRINPKHWPGYVVSLILILFGSSRILDSYCSVLMFLQEPNAEAICTAKIVTFHISSALLYGSFLYYVVDVYARPRSTLISQLCRGIKNSHVAITAKDHESELEHDRRQQQNPHMNMFSKPEAPLHFQHEFAVSVSICLILIFALYGNSVSLGAAGTFTRELSYSMLVLVVLVLTMQRAKSTIIDGLVSDKSRF
jgi:hypothetical protein